MVEDDVLFPRLDMLVSSRIYYVVVHSFVDCSHVYLIGSRYITLHGEQKACIISKYFKQVPKKKDAVIFSDDII